MLPDFSLSVASDLSNSEEKFPVDLDQAWVWLGYGRKDYCLDALKANFVVLEDFRFEQLNSNSQGGRPSNKYYTTVECFKMLGMMVGTEKGKEIRKYFLECEKIAKSTTIERKPPTALELARQNVQLLESIEALEAEKLILQPKADFADAISKVEGESLIGTFGKSIGVGQKAIFRYLRENKIIGRFGRTPNVAYQSCITQGYFNVCRNHCEGYEYFTTYITPKGQAWLYKRLRVAGIAN